MNNLMQKAYLTFYNLLRRQEGQDLVEYALVITMVSLGSVAGINNVASAVNAVFSNISNTLS
jgi:pilus assembly protein Flp/PilA